jgi:hypothetical protein
MAIVVTPGTTWWYRVWVLGSASPVLAYKALRFVWERKLGVGAVKVNFLTASLR